MRSLANLMRPRSVLAGAVCFLLAAGMACGDDTIGPPDDAPNVDLEIEMSASDATPAVGGTVVFTVVVRNNGPLAATGVLAGDTLETGLTYQSHNASAGTSFAVTGGRGIWSIGDLAVDGQATLTITAVAAAGTAGQTLQNGAGVTSTAFNDSVPANNVVTSAVQVEGVAPPPPPAGVTFSSDWSTATGTSDNALRDGGKWNTMYCAQASTTATIVAGGPVGWTKTPNVLRLQQLGPNACGTLERLNAVPLSTTHWGRFYFRNDEVGTQHNHVVTYNPGVGAPIQTALWNRNGAAGGVAIFLRTYYLTNGASSTYPLNQWFMGTPGQAGVDRLQNGVWYRYEWQMEYVTPTTYRIHPRIYNMAGTLLYDATRFFQTDYNGTGGHHSLASYYAAGNAFGFTDVTLGRRFGLGNEGPGGSTNTGGYWYHADVVLSTAGWIGQ